MLIFEIVNLSTGSVKLSKLEHPSQRSVNAVLYRLATAFAEGDARGEPVRAKDYFILAPPQDELQRATRNVLHYLEREEWVVSLMS